MDKIFRQDNPSRRRRRRGGQDRHVPGLTLIFIINLTTDFTDFTDFNNGKKVPDPFFLRINTDFYNKFNHGFHGLHGF